MEKYDFRKWDYSFRNQLVRGNLWQESWVEGSTAAAAPTVAAATLWPIQRSSEVMQILTGHFRMVRTHRWESERCSHQCGSSVSWESPFILFMHCCFMNHVATARWHCGIPPFSPHHHHHRWLVPSARHGVLLQQRDLFYFFFISSAHPICSKMTWRKTAVIYNICVKAVWLGLGKYKPEGYHIDLCMTALQKSDWFFPN